MSFPIERLYETAALGEGWPALLDDIAQSLGVAGCSLISIEAGSALNFCSPEVAEGVARYFREGWHLKNDRMQKLIAGRYTGFIRDIDIYPVEAVAEIPLVKEFTGRSASAGAQPSPPPCRPARPSFSPSSSSGSAGLFRTR